MTARDVWNSIPLKVTLIIVGVAMAWTTLKADVIRIEREKVDKADVTTALTTLSTQIAQLATEQRSMKVMLCRLPQNTHDSACSR